MFKIASTLEPTLQALANAEVDQTETSDDELDRGMIEGVVHTQEEQAFKTCELVLASGATQLLQNRA